MTPHFTLVPQMETGLPKIVKLALWFAVPLPLIVFPTFQGDMGWALSLENIPLMATFGVMTLFALEAAVIPKFIESRMPQTKIDFFDDHFVVDDGRSTAHPVPYAAVSKVSSRRPDTPPTHAPDGALLTDIILDIDREKLGDDIMAPADAAVILARIPETDDPARKIEDLVRRHQTR